MKKILLTAVIALFAVTAASAQDKGKWGIGPKIGIYTNTGADGAIFGIGAAGRYSFTDKWRIEPAITALCEKGCSVDINADVHYLFSVAKFWDIYPLAGLSVKDMTRNWDLTAGVKWMIQTRKDWKNPIVISIGAVYKF